MAGWLGPMLTTIRSSDSGSTVRLSSSTMCRSIWSPVPRAALVISPGTPSGSSETPVGSRPCGFGTGVVLGISSGVRAASLKTILATPRWGG